jgi:pyruvate-formate lyase
MASTERDPVRKKELEQIAEHCDWVPAKAPRTFAEGLQSLWFYHLAFCKENPMVPIYLGLMDHWLYPLYEKDLKEGRLTRQAAAELLGCLFVKINEGESFRGFIIAQTAAASMFRHITIGGKTKDGKDITNELSFLILEVTRQMKMRDPAVYIRYHDGINRDFLIKALEVVRDYKGGNPAFLNYEVAARNLMDYGASMEDAAEWVGSGCLNYHIPHCNIHPQALDVLNLSKILEITLHNGVDPRTGKKIGLETGDVTKFTRIEQLYEAWEKQVAWFFDIAVRSCFLGHSVRILECNSNPFGSALLEDCITKGLDLNEGGVRYPGQQVNIAAIKYLVYDNKKLTMAELLDVLAADFEGKEDVRQMCLQAPKYGNDDDYTDDIFNYVSLKVQEIMLNKPNPWTGKKWRLFRPASTGHYYQGRVVGALPNGRKAWTALNDAAFSAMGGADTKGPTALINSATEVDHFRHLNAGILNMKFSKAIVTTREKLAKVLALVKTFMERGQFHIQFNITSQQDLIEARKHPEQWKSLIVRVAGYSAYFVELPTEIQDEIIARTEHEV